jgi:hypothetical protein
MRNFSQVTHTTCFVSGWVNGGEYWVGVEPDQDFETMILPAVSAVLECDIRVISRAFRKIAQEGHANDLSWDDYPLSPAEIRVLDNLASIWLEAIALQCDSDRKIGGVSFIYVNMNTGKSVVWSLFNE